MNGIAQGLILTQRKQTSWKWPIIVVLLAVTIKKLIMLFTKFRPGLLEKWITLSTGKISIQLAPVVQRLDNAIHRINRYPMDKCWQSKPHYPLDSDLSIGQRYPHFEQPGPDGMICFVNTYPLDSDLSDGWQYPVFRQLGSGVHVYHYTCHCQLFNVQLQCMYLKKQWLIPRKINLLDISLCKDYRRQDWRF